MTNARTPTAHAASHAAAGSDPITIAESQVTNLVTDLAAKAPLASPGFTGTPTAPDQTTGDNTGAIANTKFVQTASGLLVPKSIVDAKGDLIVGTADNTVARKAVSGNKGRVLSEDSAQSDGLAWIVPPGEDVLVVPYAAPYALGQNLGSLTATRGYLMKVKIRKAGNLRDLAIYVHASSGNHRVALYDAGASTLTRLWDSGSVAAGTAQTWQILGDPNYAVAVGDELYVYFMPDNATVSYARSVFAAANQYQLPTGFPGAGLRKLVGLVNPGSFTAPATIDTNTDIASVGLLPHVVGRIS